MRKFKKRHLVVMVLVLLFSLEGKSRIQSIDENIYVIATYNIRYDAIEDKATGNGWDNRKDQVAAIIQNHNLDIVGTQEGDDKQLAYLGERLPEYDYIKEGYGSEIGSHNAAVFYRKNKFTVVSQGHFWMSKTPEVKSKGWDASDYRITQWVLFRDKVTAKEFYVFNTHFYWRKQFAKENSGGLITSKMREIAGDNPIVCMGDFNSLSDSKQIKAVEEFLVDTYKVSPVHKNKVVGTGFPGGVFTGVSDKRIDYVFISRQIDVHSYEAVDFTYDESRYPSDHLPVVVSIAIR